MIAQNDRRESGKGLPNRRTVILSGLALTTAGLVLLARRLVEPTSGTPGKPEPFQLAL